MKVKVDRGLVREEVSFAKLVADLARKQKCTVSSLKMMRGSVMETMTKDSHISITSPILMLRFCRTSPRRASIDLFVVKDFTNASAASSSDIVSAAV